MREHTSEFSGLKSINIPSRAYGGTQRPPLTQFSHNTTALQQQHNSFTTTTQQLHNHNTTTGCEVVVLWLNCVRGGRCVPP